MPAAHVQHVVRHVGARNEVGNHGHAVGPGGSRSLGDVYPADQRLGRHRVDVGRLAMHIDRLLHGRDRKHEVQRYGRLAIDRQGLLQIAKALLVDRGPVVAQGHCAQREDSVGV